MFFLYSTQHGHLCTRLLSSEEGYAVFDFSDPAWQSLASYTLFLSMRCPGYVMERRAVTIPSNTQCIETAGEWVGDSHTQGPLGSLDFSANKCDTKADMCNAVSAFTGNNTLDAVQVACMRVVMRPCTLKINVQRCGYIFYTSFSFSSNFCLADAAVLLPISVLFLQCSLYSELMRRVQACCHLF